MMVVWLIAGIGFLLAGLLAIGFGIPVKEFSFGNTLIVTDAVAACTGMIMLGLWMVVRELKNIARRLGPGVPQELPVAALSAALGDQAPGDGGFLFSRDQPAPKNAGRGGAGSAGATPWAGRCPLPRPRASRGRPSRQAAAQPLVFLVIAEGARARRGANRRSIRARSAPRTARRATAGARTKRGAAGVLRRRVAKIGTCEDRRCAAAAAPRPGAIDVHRSRRRRNRDRSLSAARAKRGAAAGHGSQIRRRRWHGLLAVFGRLDRGANARRHDAVRVHRRTAVAPRLRLLSGLAFQEPA